MAAILHHAYVKPGDEIPCLEAHIIHAQGRSEGNGLDIWWREAYDGVERIFEEPWPVR